MGGWRCTYQNCTVKGDGVTHMFHYPVFDKVRCHQWLVYAGRLDFLNLKVSQLKNRCVCQHHFKDDDFMNYMKDKIKCKAVPTEGGPYCDTSETVFSIKPDDIDYSIFEDDMANESLCLEDKKAHYSKKYSEFLGSDLSEMHQTTFNYNNMLKSEKVFAYSELTDANKTKSYPLARNINHTSNSAKFQKVSSSNAINPKLLPKVPKPKDSEKFITIEIPGKEVSELQHNTKENIEISTLNHVTKTQTESQNTQKPKVIIVSEKSIFKPFKFTGKLEPISSSVKLTPRYLRNRKNQEGKKDTSMVRSSESDLLLEGSETKKKPTTCDELMEKQLKTEESDKAEEVLKMDANKSKFPKILQIRNNLSFEDPPPVQSIVKPKIAPERLAVIKEKRNFNMKLKNIMETHLSNSKDDAEQSVGEDGDTKTNSISKRKSTITKGQPLLLNNQQLPSSETTDISKLEARMKKFEEVLLHVVNQNTQSIENLKNLILKSQSNHNKTNPQTKKTNKSTQTHCKSSYKKYLYQELSEYMSPSTNSIVYDELFIDKKVNDIPTKRRKISKRRVHS